MAILFDGVNDVITVANESSFDFDFDDPFTLSAWINTSVTGLGAIFAKVDTGASFRGFEFRVNSSVLRFLLTSTDGSDQIVIDGATAVDDGAWHHVAITYDGSDDASGTLMYVDGADDGSTVTNNLTTTTTNNISLTIGSRSTAAVEFTGQIADPIVFNVALTPREIAIMCESRMKYQALMLSQANVVSYWPMDDQPAESAAAADTVRDFFGSNDGTVTNEGTWKAEEVLSYVSGIITPSAIDVAVGVASQRLLVGVGS